MAEILDETPVRVVLRCRECRGYSARVHASPEWGPVLVTFSPAARDERAHLEPDVDRVPAVGVHVLDHPTMTPLAPSIEVNCGKGRHGRLALDVDKVLDLYQQAGTRPREIFLAPFEG
jgi:hypothetical protein